MSKSNEKLLGACHAGERKIIKNQFHNYFTSFLLEYLINRKIISFPEPVLALWEKEPQQLVGNRKQCYPLAEGSQSDMLSLVVLTHSNQPQSHKAAKVVQLRFKKNNNNIKYMLLQKYGAQETSCFLMSRYDCFVYGCRNKGNPNGREFGREDTYQKLLKE